MKEERVEKVGRKEQREEGRCRREEGRCRREEGRCKREEGRCRREEGRKVQEGGRKESAEGRKEGKWVQRKGARMEGEQEEGQGVAKSGKRQTLLSSSYANFLSMHEATWIVATTPGWDACTLKEEGSINHDYFYVLCNARM